MDSHPKVAFYNEGIKWIQLYQIVKWGKDQANNLVRNTVEEVSNFLLKQLPTEMLQLSKYFTFSVDSHIYKNIGLSFDASKFTLDAGKSMLKNIGKGFVHEVDISIANVAKSLGYYVGDNVGRVFTFSISGLKSIFLGIDMYLNSLEEKIGTAIVHTMTTALLTNFGVNLLKNGFTFVSTFPLVTDILLPAAKFFLPSPVGWAIMTSFMVTYIIDWGYGNNVFHIKDWVNNIGEKISASFDNIGQVVNDNVQSLKSTFGW